MAELVKTENQVPATQDDPYVEYGRAVSSDTAYLKFVKGKFKYGVDNEVLRGPRYQRARPATSPSWRSG